MIKASKSLKKRGRIKMFYMNVYDNTTGKAWREEFGQWDIFYKRYCKLKYSKKLWVLSHSKLD